MKATRHMIVGLLAAALMSAPAIAAPTAIANVPPSLTRAAAILRVGSRGPDVRALQSALARLTYLPASGIDATFGAQTWHAVVAFQGWNGLGRDGIVGARTRAALSKARPPTPWSRATGLEVHVSQQVLLVVSGGRTQRAIHVSTGAHGSTPLGHFRILSRYGKSWSVQFRVWMPLAQYFFRGYAIHQFSDVPAYPASHGCIRVPATDAPAVWQFGRIGMRVWTRG